MKEEINIPVTSSQLVDYAHGLLSPTAAARVKKALETEETLLWEYQGIIQLMKDHPDRDPEELLDEMVEESGTQADTPFKHPRKQRRNLIRLWKPLAAAAAIVLVVGIALLYRWQSNRQNPVLLASKMVNEATFSGDSRGIPEPSLRWQEDFKKGRYDSVINALQKIKNLSHTEQFYLGLAYLKSSPAQPGQAEANLQKATASGMEYRNDAWLYLGIAQLLQHKNNDAIKSLENLKQNAQAATLLDLLRK